MASRWENGGMMWRTGAWCGLVLLATLDGSLLMLPPASAGHHDRPEVRATAHPSHAAAERAVRLDGVRPVSDLVVPR